MTPGVLWAGQVFYWTDLIAAGKAKPMIVVMPAGHTSTSFNPGGSRGIQPVLDEFAQDFTKDLMPYAEAQYRVRTGRRVGRF